MKTRTVLLLVSTNVAATVLGYWLGSTNLSPSQVQAAVAANPSLIPTTDRLAAPLTSSSVGSPQNADASSESSPSLRPQAMAGMGLRGRMEVLMQRVDGMNDREVLAALKGIRHHPDSPDKAMAQQMMLARYGELDPETALTYAQTLVGDEYREATSTIMTAWTNRDPFAAAAHYTENLDDFGIIDANQKAVAGVIAEEWARSDSESALDWATELPPEVSGEVYGRVAAELVRHDPARAVAALDTLEPGFERTEMLESLVDQWAYQDPRSAADWMLANTSGDDQLRATTSLMNAWMDANPMEASQWLGNLSDGPVKDNAILALTQSRAVARDPDAAAAWSSTIQNEALRESVRLGLSP